MFSLSGVSSFFFSWIGTYILHFIGCHIINLPTAQKDARQKAFRALGSVWSPLLPLALGSFFLLIFFLFLYFKRFGDNIVGRCLCLAIRARNGSVFFSCLGLTTPRAPGPGHGTGTTYFVLVFVCVCEFVPFGVFAWTVVDDGIYGR